MRRLHLIPAGDAEPDLHVPDCDYVLTLDADSVILPEYCLRLVYLLEREEHSRVAVAQSPYSAFPGPATRLELIAGATTDLQHIIHQGMTYHSATFWVGANAVLRKRALEDIEQIEHQGEFKIYRYISDRTVIEDTESTIDLAAHGWTLHNYPERLAYSATPPDFGSLCIQRERWANGGLLIVPKLVHAVRLRRGRGERTTLGELLLRLNYTASIFWSSLFVLCLMVIPFNGHLLSPLTYAVAVPYFLAMAVDLHYCGYRRLDALSVYGFNLLLLAVNLTGSVNSIVQALTAAKGTFRRTPKVRDRTVPSLIYVVLPYLLVAFSAYTFKRAYEHGLWANAVFAAINAVLAAYAIVAFIGVRNSIVDIWVNVVSWLYRPRRPAPMPARAAADGRDRPADVAIPDWERVLYLGFPDRRRTPRDVPGFASATTGTASSRPADAGTIAPVRRCLLVLLVLATFPGTVAAAPVLVLGPHGRVHERNDRFLSAVPVTPVPASAPAPGDRLSARLRTAVAHRRPPKPTPPAITVKSALATLRRRGSISAAQYSQTLMAFNGALAAEKQLTGTRQTELEAVTESVHQLAVTKQLTAPRLAAVVATLNANRNWWTTGSVPAPDQRIEFAGSQLVWEYYPGQGLQLQVLGTFGKANGMYTAGPSQYPAMEQLLSQMIPLASRRAGGTTWEYYFTFDGGTPPWTSAMSQATGLEALSRAYLATKNPYYLQVAASAMAVFGKPPPVGVTVPTTLGVRFLQYTFAPALLIINADLQTLIGLYAYGSVSGNTTAQTLFAQGNAEALAALPSFNTGAWSLYEPGVEDDLSYHQLVTGFLAQLCTLTAAPLYCTTAQQFTADLTTPPVLTDLTTAAKPRQAFALSFRLSKVSHVGIVVTRGDSTVFSTSASFAYGVRTVTVPGLQAGTYGVRFAATDLAGNVSRTTGTLTVGS